MGGYKDGFKRGTNYLRRQRTALLAEQQLRHPHGEVRPGASQSARCARGEHDEAVADPAQVTYLAFGRRVEPGTRYCRRCSAVRPDGGWDELVKAAGAAAAGLPPRIAHVMHALLTLWSDCGRAVTVEEVWEYDASNEALTLQHTSAALVQARNRGLAGNLGAGHWMPAQAAWDMQAALEERFRAEVPGE